MEISRLIGKNAGNWSIKTLALAAAVLLFFYNQIISLEQETYSVPLEVQIADELSLASEVPNSVRVTVRGSDESLRAISGGNLAARVDATRYAEPGQYTITVDAVVRTNEIDAQAVDLQVQPAAVTLELDRTARRTVEVNPAVQGFPSLGFELTRSFVSPRRVEIEGPERYILSRSSIGTEPVDLTARTEPFATEVALRPPNDFIRVRGGDSVEFHGVVEEVIAETWFSGVDVSVINVPDRLNVATSPGTGSMQVRGTLLVLESLDSSDLLFEADAAELSEAGEHELGLTPVVPDGVEVLDYQPRSRSVVLEDRPIDDDMILEESLR